MFGLKKHSIWGLKFQQNILIKDLKPKERIVTIEGNSELIERITVTQPFYWRFVLYNSRLQTCSRHCEPGSFMAQIPIIHVMNENEILDALTKLTKLTKTSSAPPK